MLSKAIARISLLAATLHLLLSVFLYFEEITYIEMNLASSFRI